MTRRPSALLVVLFVLVAACGGPDGTSDAARARSGADGGGAAASGDGENGEGSNGGTSSSNGTRSGDDAGDGTEGRRAGDTVVVPPKEGPGSGEAGYPGRTAPPGAIFLPGQIRYVYTVDGRRQLPGQDAPEPYDESAALFVRLVEREPGEQGEEQTWDASLDRDASTLRTRTLWKEDGVYLIYTRMALPDLRYDCRTEPFPNLLAVRVKRGVYPEQSWSGERCSGTTQVTVHGSEVVADAQGRSWRTWKIETTTTYRMAARREIDGKPFGEVSGRISSTRWFTPDIGVDIKEVRSERGDAAGEPFLYEQTFWLARP